MEPFLVEVIRPEGPHLCGEGRLVPDGAGGATEQRRDLGTGQN